MEGEAREVGFRSMKGSLCRLNGERARGRLKARQGLGSGSQEVGLSVERRC